MIAIAQFRHTGDASKTHVFARFPVLYRVRASHELRKRSKTNASFGKTSRVHSAPLSIVAADTVVVVTLPFRKSAVGRGSANS